jgi:hypothetical protein
MWEGGLMKCAKSLQLLLSVLAAAVLSHAQSPKPLHVIVVIQENRTPDNLFQDPTLISNGADIWSINNPFPCKSVPDGVQIEPAILNTCFDPYHGHTGPTQPDGWVETYDGGLMDGACAVSVNTTACQGSVPTYPALTYVTNPIVRPGGHGILDPYYQIAETYGFANYMFQTNQGPSFPAHLFLFSGTSAPINDPNQYYNWFVAEVPGHPSTGNTGCIAPLGEYAEEIDPNGGESRGYTPPNANQGYPCYTHNSLANVLDNAKPQPVSWTYYAPPEGAGSIWTAPNALSGICPQNPGGTCDSMDWNNHVVISSTQRSILTDIQNCNLSGVSWVIPDGLWSDHSGNNARDGGPSWVAAIVNEVGENQGCDTTGYWNDTVILITWDDWGGFYDHVPPYSIGYANTGNPNIGSSYVYGFRVPLLVVSAYTKPSYISGVCGVNGNPACPNEQPQFVHDFGSILGYIEYVFGTGEINPTYHYADFYAPDGQDECGAQNCPYPLSDFFGTVGIPFTPITGAKYPPSCFLDDPQSCFGSEGYPSDPDDDEIDAD